MDKHFIERLEKRLVSHADKFNLSTAVSSDMRKAKELDLPIWNDSNQLQAQIATFNECGTSACILGHAMLEEKNSYFNLFELAKKVLPNYDSGLSKLQFAICGWSNSESFLFYGCRPKNEVTAYQAANVLRHIRLNDELPNNYKDCEEFYYG